MRRRRALLLVAGFVLASGAAPARARAPAARDAAPSPRRRREVVLVVGAGSPLVDVESLDLRRAYFGYTVRIGAGTLRALRVRGDKRLERVFLQGVVAVSASVYRYRLLANALQGLPRPPEIASPAALIEALVADPYAVGYAWAEDVADDRRVRILRVLWHE